LFGTQPFLIKQTSIVGNATTLGKNTWLEDVIKQLQDYSLKEV